MMGATKWFAQQSNMLRNHAAFRYPSCPCRPGGRIFQPWATGRLDVMWGGFQKSLVLSSSDSHDPRKPEKTIENHRKP